MYAGHQDNGFVFPSPLIACLKVEREQKCVSVCACQIVPRVVFLALFRWLRSLTPLSDLYLSSKSSFSTSSFPLLIMPALETRGRGKSGRVNSQIIPAPTVFA